MSEKREPTAKRLEIKKYPNRRFYDCSQSRHLKLEELRDLIKEGQEVRITEAQTGRDITAQVLIRILLELDPSALDSISVPILIGLIRSHHGLPSSAPPAPNRATKIAAHHESAETCVGENVE